MIKGLWLLLNSSPKLYTNRVADIIRDRQTGKEYVRGRRVLFHGENIEVPKTIEELEPNRWEFILNTDDGPSEMSAADYAREIYVQGLMGGR